MRRIAPVLALALLFGACGDDDGGGGGNGGGGNSESQSFCDTAEDFAGLIESIGQDPSGVPALAEQIDQVAADAPEEIADEAKTLNDAFQAVADAVESVPEGADQQQSINAILTALGQFDQAQLAADQQAVLDYLEEECGVTIGTDGADDPAVSTTTGVENNDG